LAIADETRSGPVIRIWDEATQRTVGTLVGHPTGFGTGALACSPDSRYLVSVIRYFGDQPGEVLLWDLAAPGIVGAE
jgi:WD40 repeat protein